MFGDEREVVRKPGWQRIGVPALVVVFVSGGAFGIVNLLKHSSGTARPHIEQHIAMITLPPPPPPPPPPPEKPQEKQVEQKVEQKIQQQKPQAPKVAAPQALTATAGVGNDAYGLKAGEGGGGDCVSDCGSGDSDQGPYYESVVRSLVQDALRGDDRLRSAHYHGVVTFVFDQYGRVQNVRFEDFEGDADTRDLVVRALANVAVSESLPSNMENVPWKVRINAHSPG
jgi:periplasmic protein TonB